MLLLRFIWQFDSGSQLALAIGEEFSFVSTSPPPWQSHLSGWMSRRHRRPKGVTLGHDARQLRAGEATVQGESAGSTRSQRE